MKNSRDRQLKLAWFSPLPPSRSGIAAYSAELLPVLAERGYEITAFTETTARDFVWRHRRRPFDLTVYQMGNAACHDFMWPYLFRYPGMVVLHDAQLHQARALALTRRWLPRRDDYLAEFRANHPDAPSSIGEVVAAGFGASLFAHWPHIRLVVESARLAIVHNHRLLQDLKEQYPRANLEVVTMGVRDPLLGRQTEDVAAEHAVRARHGIPSNAVVLAAFGGLTPEKRIRSLLRALSTAARRHPALHLMLVGNPVSHYDVLEEARRWAVADRVHVTGYVPDEVLPDYLVSADICACLRWPTNRETSASWLRCLAAGRPTIVSDLADLVDVPTLDPRGWLTLDTAPAPREPVAISVDVVDEDHCLQLALDSLIENRSLRERVGLSARTWWHAHHQVSAMADDYERTLAAASISPAPRIELPPHLTADTSDYALTLAREIGVLDRVARMFDN